MTSKLDCQQSQQKQVDYYTSFVIIYKCRENLSKLDIKYMDPGGMHPQLLR